VEKHEIKTKVISSLVIRDACEADKSSWENLWRQYLGFYKQHYSKKVEATTWQRLIIDEDNSMFSIVASTQDNDVVAFANCVLLHNTWNVEKGMYLEDLFVVEKFRGMGIGKKMILELKRRAQLQNLSRVFWHTTEDNYNAQKLYNLVAKKTDFIQYRLDLQA